jgi:hypothetical protein
LAGRPRKSNAGLTKRLESEKSLLKTAYEFEVGTPIIYIGKLHEQYYNKTGVITKRACKGHRIDYSVKFNDDGKVVNCLLQNVLKPVYEQVSIEESMEENKDED